MSVRISKKWIREHVEEISAFGGQINKEDVLDSCRIDRPCGGFLTDLNSEGIENAETKEIRFFILIPGIGWGTAYSYPSEEERWEREMVKEEERKMKKEAEEEWEARKEWEETYGRAEVEA
jgi:hypothetical protein